MLNKYVDNHDSYLVYNVIVYVVYHNNNQNYMRVYVHALHADFDFYIYTLMCLNRYYNNFSILVDTFQMNWVLNFSFSNLFDFTQFVNFKDFNHVNDHQYTDFHFSEHCDHMRINLYHSTINFHLNCVILQSFYYDFFIEFRYLHHNVNFLYY